MVGGNEELSNAIMKMEEDERERNSNSIPRKDEEYKDDICIQVDEEMTFLEEEIEKFLFLEEMPGIEDFPFQEEELEDEVCLMEYEYTYSEEEGATALKETDKDLKNNLKSQVLHRGKLWKTSKETHRFHLFEANERVVSVFIEKGKENISFLGMKAEQDQYFIEADGTNVSHASEPIINENREKLASIGGQKENSRQLLGIVDKESGQNEENVKEEDGT